MAIVSTFANLASLQATVKGCPQATFPPAQDEGPCAGCRFNVVHPGQPRVGCSWRTPPAVLQAALAALAARNAELSTELQKLRDAQRNGESVQGARAEQWRRVALEWMQALPPSGDAEAREVCTVVGRFAEASLRLSQAVSILR